jgi:uncharacterized protein (DUF488 family)
MNEILTIGHSTRSLEELLALLGRHRVQAVADVRRYPYSRRHPHFNRDRLAAALEAAEMEYRHVPELGGRRTPAQDSPNTAWRDPGFRGFADHMQSPEFEQGLAALLELGSRRRIAILCAEALPSKCHRSLIADALVARRIEVAHILSDAPPESHALSSRARVEDRRVQYPGPQTELPR